MLGPARDLDVFAVKLVAPLERALAVETDLKRLSDAVEQRRLAAYERVKDAIASQRYTAMILRRVDLLLTGCRTPPAEVCAPARILRSRSLARRNALRSGRPHYRTAHTSCPTSPLATRVFALPCSAHSWVPVEAR